MDQQGQSSRSSRGQRSRGPPTRRTDARPRNLSDGEGQLSRIPSKSTSSSSGDNPRTGRKQTQDAPPQVHRTPSTPSAYPLSQSRTPYTTPSGHHMAKGGTPPTPALSNNSTARRGPPGQTSRSNPTAPIWGTGPDQHREEHNTRLAPYRGAPSLSAPYPTRAPGRKAASSGPSMWDPTNEPQSISVGRMVSTPPKKRPPIEICKATTPSISFWQQLDAVYEARQKTERRISKLGDIGDHIPFKQTVIPPQRSYLSPTVKVIRDPPPNEDSDTDGSLMDVDAPPQRSLAIKTTQPQSMQTRDLARAKAARKAKWAAPRGTPEDSSESSSSQSGSDSEWSNSVIDLTDTSNPPDNEATLEKEDAERDPVSENGIIMVEPPQPLITISLPQITPSIPQPPTSLQGPPDVLLTALEEVCLSSVRMQQTKQLPFLRRNLRRGFRNRCSAIGYKTSRSKPRIPILSRYEYMGLIFEARASLWLCPLCGLHGAFPNGNLLRLHIQWDHAEIILERWEQRTNNQGKPEWRIQLLIPEITYEKLQPRTYDFKTEPQETPIDTGATTPRTRETRSATAPPPQSLSPTPTTPHTSSTPGPDSSVEPLRDVTPAVEFKPRSKEGKAPESATSKPSYSNWKEYALGRAQRPSTAPSSSSRSRSFISTTEATEESISTVRIEQTPGPRGGLYPSPPPVQDPLGPATKFPYLPAKSEYDGPDIYYSCRPGGPSPFDLLGTLPIDPFGVLEWDILDREEEIFESDDVKVEQKVMSALWLRWITLNRPMFIQNYYKGILAFIDMYWRMIHQAAGWRAMQFWLVLLLANRFLTAPEAAKALQHYEALTGMQYW